MCPVTTLTQRLRARWWRLAAPLLDIRLRPRLRHDPSAPLLMLSPHLDDAVINCWSVLTADGDVQAVNVCSRPPDPGFTPYWDRNCGAEDSPTHCRARL